MSEVCYYCNKLLGAFIEKTVVQLQPKKGMRRVRIGVMCEMCEDAGRAPTVTEDKRPPVYEKRYGVDTDGVVTVL